MEPVAVPEIIKQARADHRLVSMGPPPGVSGDDCGTAEMLIGKFPDMALGPRYFPQRAYYQPDEGELETLNAGGYIEVTQWGSVVQPFACHIWGNGEDVVTIKQDPTKLDLATAGGVNLTSPRPPKPPRPEGDRPVG